MLPVKRRPERDEHLVSLMNKVSDLMRDQKVSQAELARRMNTNRASVSKMLKLQVDPLASTLVAMLHALDHDIAMSPKQDQM